ncbi:MAG: tetratricopeptide repeat protein [Planctomycetales bacterium]|nr:tetratricopeptide repeat protein [Planctomycetales bacterium]
MAEPDSALVSAIDSLNRGDFEQAGIRCRQVLEHEPENAKAWHLAGIVHAQQNELNRAVECFEKAIQLRGDVANYHYNLGLAYQRLSDCDGAAEAYRRAVEIKPDFIEAQNNLGNCLIEKGEPTDAVDHFRKLAELFPDESVVHYNLANVLQDAGEYLDSIAAFRRAIELDPDFSSARENLGRALSDVKRYDEALDVWKAWLDHDPNNAVAKHMVVSITGEGTPERCEDDYVRETFDQNFAQSYEKQLERILYKVPELIGQAINSIGLDADDLDILDAGCGTGLCAAVLRPLAGRLVGVDLSGDMLDEATKRGVYDDLHEHELTGYLNSGVGPFDLIVSGDTLCYFGDLKEVLAGMRNCLKDDGHVVFTVEQRKIDDDPDSDFGSETETPYKPYELQPHGRYRHDESYVRDTLEEVGFSTIDIAYGTLRMERGREVIGLIVTATLNA